MYTVGTLKAVKCTRSLLEAGAFRTTYLTIATISTLPLLQQLMCQIEDALTQNERQCYKDKDNLFL